MPLVLSMGLPGVVVSGSTLTWLESGSGGEWVRWETERKNLDFGEPRPGLGTEGFLPVALPRLPSLPSWDPLHSLRVLDAPSPFFPGSLHWKEEEISIDISVFLCFQQDCWCFQSHAAKNDIPTKQTKQFEPSTKPYSPSKYQFSSKICLLWLIDFFYYYFCFLVFCPEFNWTKSKSTVIPACSEQKFPGGEIFYVLVLYKFM